MHDSYSLVLLGISIIFIIIDIANRKFNFITFIGMLGILGIFASELIKYLKIY